MTSKNLEKIIDEQVRKWEMRRLAQKREAKDAFPVITICREPGSGGRVVARRIAEKLGLDLFDREIIQKLVQCAHSSKKLIETLDERSLSVLQDWIATLIFEKHLWPDQYLKHLLRVIGTIGKHGHAVIVGRGANFILPPDDKLSVRIVAPFRMRTRNVARDFNVQETEASRRILRTEAERKAFIRTYFHADISDPVNYDLVLNRAKMGIEDAADAVIALATNTPWPVSEHFKASLKTERRNGTDPFAFYTH